MHFSAAAQVVKLPCSSSSTRSTLKFFSTSLALPTSLPWLLAALLYCTLIVPIAALDNDPYALTLASLHRPYPGGHRQAMIGPFMQFCFFVGGVAVMISGSVIGPLMGVTSVLWLMMRNDSAIDPRVSWMVFGAWSFFFFAYFMVQCSRVYNHGLYIFLSLALASICVCVIALLQRASLQSGLVTVIPPCASFAAYSVAYIFPKRQQERVNYEV